MSPDQGNPGTGGDFGGWVIWLLMLPLTITNLVAAYKGHASFGLLAAWVICFLALVLIGTIINTVRKSPKRTQAKLLKTYARRPVQQRSATPGQMRTLARALRVQALLKPPCPVCEAAEDVSCKPIPEVALIDREHGIYCHYLRMQKAVALGYTTRQDVIDQWGGNIPEGLKL